MECTFKSTRHIEQNILKLPVAIESILETKLLCNESIKFYTKMTKNLPLSLGWSVEKKDMKDSMPTEVI